MIWLALESLRVLYIRSLSKRPDKCVCSQPSPSPVLNYKLCGLRSRCLPPLDLERSFLFYSDYTEKHKQASMILKCKLSSSSLTVHSHIAAVSISKHWQNPAFKQRRKASSRSRIASSSYQCSAVPQPPCTLPWLQSLFPASSWPSAPPWPREHPHLPTVAQLLLLPPLCTPGSQRKTPIHGRVIP